MSYIIHDKNGNDCHNFGIQNGCAANCPQFQRGECTLWQDGDFDEVATMINQFQSGGQLSEDEAAYYREQIYQNLSNKNV